MGSLSDAVAKVQKSSGVSIPSTTAVDPKIAKSQKQLTTTGKKITKAKPSLADAVAAIKAGEHHNNAGGLLGWTAKLPVLHQIFSVLSTKPVQSALNVLDTPRAAVTSLLKETEDQFFTHNNPGGFSVRDLGNQIIHPAKRISGADLIKTQLKSGPLGPSRATLEDPKNKKLVDIATGISGLTTDILADPLTYVGGTGLVKKGVGETAQFATKGLSKADLAAKVLEKTDVLGEDVAKALAAKVAAKGKAALGPEERALLNAPDPGLFFAKHRIPGSSVPMEGLQKVAGAIGEKVSTGKLGKLGHTLGKSPEEAAALDKILASGGDVNKVVEGLGQRASILAERAASRAAEDRLTRIIKNSGILKDVAKEDGRKLIDAVEGQIPATELSGKLSGALKKLHTLADEAGVQLNELGGYFPHQVEPAAAKLIRKTPELRQFLLKTGTQGPEKFRALTAGEQFLGTTLKTGSLGEINDLFAKNFSMPLFKTDTADVLTSYAQNIARAAGRNKGAEELVRMGLAKPTEQLVNVAGTPQALALADVAQGAQDAASASYTKAQRISEQARASRQQRQVLADTVRALKKAEPGATGKVAEKIQKAQVEMDRLAKQSVALKSKAQRAAIKANKLEADVAPHVDNLRSALSGADAEVRRKGAVVSDSLHSADPQVAAHGAVEAKALVAEKKLAATPPTFENIQEILANEGMRQVMAQGVDEGYKLLSKGYQAPADLVDAMRVVKQMKDPKWWDGLTHTYDLFNNYFKAWAVNSPGFLARNFYSGVFNNYIAGVKFTDHLEFRELWNIYKKDPEHYLETIATKFDPAYADAFEQARVAMGATGAGQTKDEVIRSLTRPKYKHEFKVPGTEVKLLPKESKLVQASAAVNPLKSDSYLTRAISGKNEDVEAILRGAHAWHALREGKTMQETIASITKYHFNYRDLSDFDRVAKKIIPFWTFTARNVPLQLQIFATEPWRLNRINEFRNNVQSLSNPDAVVPDYFGTQSATRLPFQIPGTHGTNYFIPDLPLFRLNETLVHATDPIRLFSDANPLIKTAIERYSGKQLFSDVPFQNKLVEAPSYAKIPGVTQVLQQFGLVKKAKDGTILMTDKDAATLDSVIPALGRIRRLNPVGQETKYNDRLSTSALSFVGSSFATNTPNAQNGELYRRQKQLDALVKQLTDRGFIKSKKAP